MTINKEKMWRSAERALKRTAEYQDNRELGQDKNYSILYVLAKGNRQKPDDVVAFAGYEESVISFHPAIGDEVIQNWDFNIDSDLFAYLESGYELAGMTLDTHYNMWCMMEDWHEGGFDCEKGMQKYLGYCKRNNITLERLQADAGYSGMDVMKLYDPKADRVKANKEQER